MSARELIGASIVLALFHGLEAHAAPAEDDPTADEVAEDQAPTIDPEVLEQGRRLYKEGNHQYELGDCATAITAWELAYEQLPSIRAQLQMPLANAHMCAYETDQNPEHLHAAKALASDYYHALDASDEEIRAPAKTLIDEVEAELARLDAEAEEREQEFVEREAAAREEIAREVETNRVKDMAWSDRDQRRFNIQVGSGGALVGLGAASLGVMGAGLALGERVDHDGNLLTMDPDTPDTEYQDLLEKGMAYNTMAYVTGAVGGALLGAGVGLVIAVVVKRKRKLKYVKSLSWEEPRWWGGVLRF